MLDWNYNMFDRIHWLQSSIAQKNLLQSFSLQKNERKKDMAGLIIISTCPIHWKLVTYQIDRWNFDLWLAFNTFTHANVTKYPSFVSSNHYVLPNFSWRFKGPSLYYVSEGTGWVGLKSGNFLLTFSTLFILTYGGSEKVSKFANVM